MDPSALDGVKHVPVPYLPVTLTFLVLFVVSAGLL
jgi:hypothetical protein